MSSKIEITLSRDSVCLADDVDDHTIKISLVLQGSPNEAITKITEKYLPCVKGYGHTWCRYLNGKNVAAISGNCAKFTFCSDILTFSDVNKLNFKYHSATY